MEDAHQAVEDALADVVGVATVLVRALLVVEDALTDAEEVAQDAMEVALRLVVVVNLDAAEDARQVAVVDVASHVEDAMQLVKDVLDALDAADHVRLTALQKARDHRARHVLVALDALVHARLVLAVEDALADVLDALDAEDAIADVLEVVNLDVMDVMEVVLVVLETVPEDALNRAAGAIMYAVTVRLVLDAVDAPADVMAAADVLDVEALVKELVHHLALPHARQRVLETVKDRHLALL